MSRTKGCVAAGYISPGNGGDFTIGNDTVAVVGVVSRFHVSTSKSSLRARGMSQASQRWYCGRPRMVPLILSSGMSHSACSREGRQRGGAGRGQGPRVRRVRSYFRLLHTCLYSYGYFATIRAVTSVATNGTVKHPRRKFRPTTNRVVVRPVVGGTSWFLAPSDRVCGVPYLVARTVPSRVDISVRFSSHSPFRLHTVKCFED